MIRHINLKVKLRLMSILKPKFKLPLELIDNDYTDIEDSEGVIVATINTKQNDALVDGNYIVQACNNFPKTVGLLKEFIFEWENSGSPKYDLDKLNDKIDEFLKSLEKDGK